jgi:uncharacterized membrane protein YgcG
VRVLPVRLLVLRVLTLFIAVVLFTVPTFAATYPTQQNYVADEAGVLSESTIRALETANKTLKLDAGVTIAVCTVTTTGDTDIMTYARAVYRDWKLGEGVLILIASADEDYAVVQSNGIEDIITNDTLTEIRDEYLEEDFEAGNIDRGVNKFVTKLKNILTVGLSERAEKEASEEESTEEASTSSPVVSGIAGFFKTLLIIVCVIAVLVVAVLVAGMFNDTAAALIGWAVRKITNKPDNSKINEEYYDERLYGNGSNRNGSNRNGNRNGSSNGNRNRNGSGYSNGQHLSANQVQQRLRAPSNGVNPQRNAHGNAQGQHVQGQHVQGQYARGQRTQGQNRQNRTPNYNNNGSVNGNGNAQYNRRQSYGYGDGNETRAFTIPNNTNNQNRNNG